MSPRMIVVAALLFSTSSASLTISGTPLAGPNLSWIASHPTNRSLLFARRGYPGQILLTCRTTDFC
ncbi:hypothetical protein BS47DRAFT_1351149 [Hydnum rufescens UP504]|uniref:Uncharacterized protein n=1 Tax=Hydnum rufescens UP504 TaxID=1448309 RepID=A0A9P6DNA7_9AGAM|nr:hypothetical protein BS47DRAFT_1351149 [Hydnum rufescens UP504]